MKPEAERTLRVNGLEKRPRLGGTTAPLLRVSVGK
jgi:hypothetical protein